MLPDELSPAGRSLGSLGWEFARFKFFSGRRFLQVMQYIKLFSFDVLSGMVERMKNIQMLSWHMDSSTTTTNTPTETFYRPSPG